MTSVHNHNRSGRIRWFSAWMAALCSILALSAQAALPVAQGSQSYKTQAASGPDGNQASDWTYTLQAGEQLDDVVYTLLGRGYDSQQLCTYNNISVRTVLAGGDTVRIPLSWLKRQPGPALAAAIEGEVQQISGATGHIQALTENQRIRPGDEIISRSGTASIVLVDGSMVRLGPNTRLAFNRLTQYGETGMGDVRLRLKQGALQTKVQPLIEGRSRFEIETPSAVAAVRGTAFELQTESGVTRLQVTEGLVAFGAAGNLKNIPAGYSASIDNHSPGNIAIYKRPPAPELAFTPAQTNSLPLTLGWEGNGSDRYQVDIFEGEHGRWVRSETVSGNHFNLNYLDNGHYNIQIAALNNTHITGMPGTTFIDVELLAKAAELLMPEDGAITNNDMPEFTWAYHGNNEVGRLEIAEAPDFNNVLAPSEWAPDTIAIPSIPLKPGLYHWRVVTEAGGTSVATSASRSLIINGSLPPTNIISANYIDNQVRIFWEKADMASEYLIQLAEDPKFARVVKQAMVTDTTAALRLLPGKRYFVRVKAVSDGPLSAYWGAGRELYID